MEKQFRVFLDDFLEAWATSNLDELSEFISTDYKAREISKGEVVDFGYEQSIVGWEEAFQSIKENNQQWLLNEISISPLRADEILVVISASILIDGRSLENANLFFNTFKSVHTNDWKLVRSYIEVGIPRENLKIYN